MITGATHGPDGTINLSNTDGIQTPVDAWIKTTYPRQKGDKLLHRLSVPPTNLTHDPDIALTRFDWVCPVDTNTTTADGNISFVGCMQVKVLQEKPGEFLIRTYRRLVIELHNVTVSPERLGWWFVTSNAVNKTSEDRIVLLVDSELSEHAAINRREKPLIGNFMLPEGFELMYASTDAGAGHIANHLLRTCDSIARKESQFLKGINPPPLHESDPGALFSHIRIWEHNL